VKLVTDRQGIINNIRQLQRYATSPDPEERRFHQGLIRRGRCFVYLREGDSYVFAPSRFVGYESNSHTAHARNPDKDGRVTNPALNHILGCLPEANEELEVAYRRYCARHGIDPGRQKRTYWRHPV